MATNPAGDGGKRAGGDGGRKPGSDLGQFADLGMRLAIVTAVFTFAGYKLDEWLSTGPWLLIVMCFVGVTGGMMSVIRGVNRWQTQAKKPQRKPGSEPEQEVSTHERP